MRCTIQVLMLSLTDHERVCVRRGLAESKDPTAERVYEKPTCKLKIDLPKMKTLFDECVWGPFVSNEEPGPGSWDAEDRATITSVAKGALRKHACGDKGRIVACSLRAVVGIHS